MTYADPWVLQGLMGRDALGRVDGQHLVDEVFGFRSNGVPLRGWELQKEVGHRARLKPLPWGRAHGEEGKPRVWRSPPSTPAPTHIIGPSLDLLVQLVLVLIPERWVAHQQDIQDHPCGWGGEQHSPGGHQGQSSVSLCAPPPWGGWHKQPLIPAPSPPYCTREPGQPALLYPHQKEKSPPKEPPCPAV